MCQRPPRSPRTYTLCPVQTHFRSVRAVRYRKHEPSRCRWCAGFAPYTTPGYLDDSWPSFQPLCTSELHQRHRPLQPCQVSSRSEEQTSELQSLMRNSYAVFCLNKKKSSKYIPDIVIIKQKLI